ncbi:ABC-type branched-chain amino acid transport systems periplasmic component-like protein [Parafrankia sp. EUN1f]|nr:ABC-type branched-chain amino acid transport systems periplasmic component-like protein [Parafrankia sp. EUN1f]
MQLGRLTRHPAVGIVAALTAVIAGCSGSGAGSEGSQHGTTAACAAPGVTADQVRIGLVYTDSGTGSSSLASARAGINARLGLINEQGGVNGRRIVYTWRDDESSNEGALQGATELVQKENVFGLISASSSLASALDSLAKQQIPVTGLVQSGWGSYNNLFSFIYDVSPEITARYIQSHQGDKVAFLMSGSEDFTRQIIGKYRAAFEGAGLSTNPDIISYTSGVDSPVRVTQLLESSGADSIVAFTDPRDLAEIMQAAQARNVPLVSVVSLTGYDHSVLRAYGPALANVAMAVNFRPFEAGGAPIEQYRAAMARFSPEVVDPEQQFAMYGYLYADLFIRGLRASGDCPTREGFIDGLRKVADYDGGGLVEPVNLANIANQPLLCNAFVRVSPDGTAFQLDNERVCANGTVG